jgi:outer membrane protein OmpA-like peptidoglycan-associated protein
MSGFLKFLSVAAFCLASLPLRAQGEAEPADYMAPFDRATWRVEKSALNCRLHQTVPRYGDVVFEAPAGGQQLFYVVVDRNPMQGGPGRWIASAPSWNPDRAEQPLGGVVVGEGRQPILLDEVEAGRLLEVLRDGMVPQLIRPGVADGEPVRLRLSPVNFQRAYEQYQGCIAQLLPHSFDQMASTPIQFARDRSDLDRAARAHIDLVLRYFAAERRASGRAPRFDIDVLSDDTYRRVENLELSKLRAQSVVEYLASRGIAAESIVTHHRSVRGGGDLSRRSVTIRMRRVGGDASPVAQAASASAAASID